MRNGYLVLLVGSTLFATSSHAQPGWKYVITDIQVADLGTMGGKESVANDINDYGEIVGWSYLADGTQHGFLWRGYNMEDITPLRGYIGEARGINNSTEVVGYIRNPNSEKPHAFHWDGTNWLKFLDEAYTDEASQNPICSTGSDAKAINNRGEIAGQRIGGCNPPTTNIWRAAHWASQWAPWEALLPNVGPGGYYIHAENINSEGTVIAWEENGYSFTGAFHWNAGVADDVPFPAVPSPLWVSPSYMKPYGINDNGAVVGSAKVHGSFASPDYMQRAFLWNGHAAQGTLLPPLVDVGAAAAYEINNDGFSVGYGDDRDRWAVVWWSNDAARSMPMAPGTSNGLLNGRHCEAHAVNNRNAAGLVRAVGYCKVGGSRHAVLWTMTTKKVTIVQPTP